MAEKVKKCLECFMMKFSPCFIIQEWLLYRWCKKHNEDLIKCGIQNVNTSLVFEVIINGHKSETVKHIYGIQKFKDAVATALKLDDPKRFE
jgi:predicted ATP-dependent Lon-type protease